MSWLVSMRSCGYGAVFYLLLSLLFVPAHAQTIYTENFPPYNYEVDGKLLGLSSKIIQKMAREIGVEPSISFLPWARAYKYAKDRENSGIFSIVRVPSREPDFQWVGPIETVNMGIYTSELNDNEYFGENDQRLEQAKEAVSIGVQRGGAAEKILMSMGFKNLHHSATSRKAILRLIDHRYELLALDGNYLQFILEAENIPQSRIRRVADIGEFDLYLAFSNSTPTEIVEKWQQALDTIRNRSLSEDKGVMN
ncbi:substrate-binding periplasmic protein [Kiloniella majae]|uniref:substrate-binding periplasmic protein n=1 Tax=Kiloniella majae TaxID=1938558 RepID=UPI000A2792CB|nr:transporter substrate-binding domain-containing protein [Kiloniella majae]